MTTTKHRDVFRAVSAAGVVAAILWSRGASAAPPAGFSVTCSQSPSNPNGCSSSWEYEVRGTQEYEERDSNNLTCHAKVYFRVGRSLANGGLHNDWVVLRQWEYSTSSWNYNLQITTHDTEEQDYDDLWDPQPDDLTKSNFRLTDHCDQVVLSRINKGLKDRWGALPPDGATEDSWTYPDLAVWKDYALSTLDAIHDADLSMAIKAANGQRTCKPGVEDDTNPDNDNLRCVISTEQP